MNDLGNKYRYAERQAVFGRLVCYLNPASLLLINQSITLGNKYAERQAVWGRLVCDLNISAKELIRCKSYELGALVEKCLPGEGEEDKRVLLTPDGLRLESLLLLSVWNDLFRIWLRFLKSYGFGSWSDPYLFEACL